MRRLIWAVSSGSMLFASPVIINCGSEINKWTISIYSRTSMVQTSLGPWKFVRDMGTLSQWGLIMTPGQGAQSDNLGKYFRFSTTQYNCMLCYSLESPRWGDSNEYTQHTTLWWNMKVSLNICFFFCLFFFLFCFLLLFFFFFFFLSSWKSFAGTQNEFELTIVNEPSVFELLRFDCSFTSLSWI